MEEKIADGIKKGTISQFFDFNDYKTTRAVSRSLRDAVNTSVPREKIRKLTRYICSDNEVDLKCETGLKTEVDGGPNDIYQWHPKDWETGCLRKPFYKNIGTRSCYNADPELNYVPRLPFINVYRKNNDTPINARELPNPIYMDKYDKYYS